MHIKKKGKSRVLSWSLTLLMVASLLPTELLGGTFVAKAAEVVHTLDATADLEAFAQGAKADGEVVALKEDADTYFTLYASAKMKVDGSNKTFDDDYSATQRINPGGSSAVGETTKNVIKFKTEGPATIKVWWVCGGDGRAIAIWDSKGETVDTTDKTAAEKDGKYISTLETTEAGTYYIAVPDGSNYIFKVQVTDKVPPTLDATKDLVAFAAGEKADGEVVTINGADASYFTLYASAKMKVDGSTKTFDDGYIGTQRINPGGSSSVGDNPKNVIKFKTEGSATIKLWWASGGDGRQMAILNASGTEVDVTAEASVKNDPYISTLEVAEAGTYYVAVSGGSNYIFKVQVTETQAGTAPKPPRAAWAEVDGPSLGTIALDSEDNGTICIPYTMLIGYDGADSVLITVKDSKGTELKTLTSLAEGESGTKEFEPTKSDTYTFSIKATREGEEDKVGTDATFDFKLPLEKPTMISATSKGKGTALLRWTAVPEATGYNIYVDDTKVATTTELSYTVTGLTVGTTGTFTVSAVRGEEEGGKATALSIKITEEAKAEWGFTAYGPSTNSSNNGYTGNLNEDGKVTVYSESGKGKIQPDSTDGLAFYYAPISTDLNFTLRAKVHVDSWTYSNGQDGFGIMVADRLGPSGNTNPFWTNQYMAILTKVEYTSTVTGAKYSMRLGAGMIEKVGVTPTNLPLLDANKKAEVTDYSSAVLPLDFTAEKQEAIAGTYNIVGNPTTALAHTSLAEITDFVLEIQRNNTGYFVTYYDANGNIIHQIKNYDPEALDKLDSEFVYAGFFASRNARITVSDVVLTTVEPEKDAPAEERPITVITPAIDAPSADITNGEAYKLALYPNVAGKVTVSLNGKEVEKDVALVGEVKATLDMTGLVSGENTITIVFTPDANQDLGEYTKLANANPITITKTVVRSGRFTDLNNIYVAPDGLPDAKGSKANPTDIYTAIANVRPGQTIIILEGTYKLDRTVRVERGIDGTAENKIRLVADAGAKTRPVFDFQGKCAGMVFGGNYWYLNGFDVTNSKDGEKGIQISGNYNVVDNVNTYHNGNTGIQISRLYSSDLFPEWPANNLIKNCTSYGNADSGYEDADGFAAKLTVGEGNVFDGCVAYNNADDGWDLYAKVSTGPIGSVTIKNCVAYRNGYLEDGTNAGNGNGFKMGGESITGKHVLINSYAFFNKAKGIDSNSCPDIIVKNSISYNNESYNVAFYTNNATNTDFSATGILSFKDNTIKSGLGTGENLKPKGTQDTTKYEGATNFYWDGSKSANKLGEVADATWFKSLTFTGITRNADGTINMNGFLELTDKVPEGIGAVMTGVASDKVEINTNDARPEIVEEVKVTEETKSEDILAAVEVVLGKQEAATEEVTPVVKVDTATITKEVLEGIKGVDVTIRLTDDNGILWDITGQLVAEAEQDVDLNVSVNGKEIPKSAIDSLKKTAEIKGTDKVITLSIEHDGDFGFTARMKYPMENLDGKYATLIWYHDGKFEIVETCQIENGYVEFDMTHASEYVLVVADALVKEVPKTGDTSTANFFSMLMLAGAAFLVVGYKKRNAFMQ